MAYNLSKTGAQIDNAINSVIENGQQWTNAASVAAQADTKATQALAKATNVESELSGKASTQDLSTKADTVSINGAKLLKPNQLIFALQTVEKIADSAGENDKMWWSSQNNHLKYKSNNQVYDLGTTPPYILYYCGSTIYKWNGNGFTAFATGEGGTSTYDGSNEIIVTFSYNTGTRVITLKQDGYTAKTLTLPVATTGQPGLMSKTDKENLDSVVQDFQDLEDEIGTIDFSKLVAKDDGGHIKYAELPRLVLENITHDINSPSNISGAVFCPNESRIRFLENGISMAYSAPDEGIVYFNKADGKFYRWGGSSLVAITTSYNDLTNTPTIPTASTSTPLMDGTASSGSGTTYAKGNHRHPTDTSRVPTSRTINGYALSADITLTAEDVGADNLSQGHGYAVCSTAASTTAKTATLSGFKKTSYGVVVIKFNSAVPSNATLNINSTGASGIYYNGAAITSGTIKAGDICTFMYNGEYYNLLSIDRWGSELAKLNSISVVYDIDQGFCMLGGPLKATPGIPFRLTVASDSNIITSNISVQGATKTNFDNSGIQGYASFTVTPNSNATSITITVS